VKCDCTCRAKPFAATERDSMFDAEHISHGQSIAFVSFLAKTSVAITVLFGLNCP